MIEYKDAILSDNEINNIKNDIALASSLSSRTDYDGSEENKKSGKSWFVDKFICSQITPNIANLCEKFDYSDNYSVIYSEYGDKDFYKKHKDDSIKTVVYFYKENDDDFIGGELKIENSFYKHKNNDCVVFNGYHEHEVLPVNTRNGTRKTITIFYY